MLVLLLVGLAGSWHCVGMCGGFVLALDRPGTIPWRRLAWQGLFHVGKAGTYVLLGALLGTVGAVWLHASWFAAARALLSALAGALMVLAGLQIGGWLKELPVGGLFGPGSLYDRAVKAVINLRGPTAPVALGMLTGFLPCPLVYAFLMKALETGGTLPAIGVMTTLALATVPALALVVVLGATFGPRLRARAIRVAGVVVVVMGLVTIVRGVFPDLLHGPGGHGDHGASTPSEHVHPSRPDPR